MRQTAPRPLALHHEGLMLTHSWHLGIRLFGDQLATCASCGTLRVQASDGRRTYLTTDLGSPDRIRRDGEPPCVTTPRRPVPW